MSSELQSDSEMRARQRDNWNRAAPGWRERGERSGETAISARLIEMAGVKPGQRVLDLACGVGNPALTIAQVVGPRGSVLGLDLSQGMLDGAAAMSRERVLTNVEFRRIERETELGVPDGSFDAATCRFGLMFMPEPVAALAAVRRALRPGARLAVCTWAGPEQSPYFSLPTRIVGRHTKLPPIDPLSPEPTSLPSHEIVAELLLEAGFQVAETDTVPATLLTAESPAAWWDARITASGPPLTTLLAGLSDEVGSAIREDAIRTISAMVPDGPVEIGADALLTAGINPG